MMMLLNSLWGLGGGAWSPSFLSDSMQADWWYAPTTGNPGRDAVSGTDLWTRTGTATGFYTGPTGQEVVRQAVSGSSYASANAGVGVANPWEQLNNTSQFWLLLGWNPRSSVNGYNGLFLSGGGSAASAGLRVFANGTNGYIVVQISDGTNQHTLYHYIHDYGAALFNTMLIQVDLTGTASLESWSNGFGTQLAGGNYQAIAGPVWTGTPISNAFPIRVGDADGLAGEGDIMAAGGRGLLTKREISALLNYGSGLAYSHIGTKPHSEADHYRPIINNDATAQSLRIAGTFDTDPTIKIYAEGADRTARGSLVASATPSRDSFRRGENLFTGLTNDTKYHGVIEYGGVESTQEFRIKTPRATLNGTRIVAGGCWNYYTDRELYAALGNSFHQMKTLAPDYVLGTGDDLYGDLTWNSLLGESGNAATLPDMQRALNHIGAFWEPCQLRHVNYIPGPISDHDLFFADGDYTAPNFANAVDTWRSRYGSLNWAAAGKTYRSFRTPGLTWIVTDTRSDFNSLNQLMGATQITWVQTEMTAAVGRGDFIILATEKPFHNPAVPLSIQEWGNVANVANRTALFDAIVASGAVASGRSQVLVITGDFHAFGVDDGLLQSKFDTGAICQMPSINASRVMHSFPEGQIAGGWNRYANVSMGHLGVIDFAVSGSTATMTITPHENSEAKTPIVLTLVK